MFKVFILALATIVLLAAPATAAKIGETAAPSKKSEVKLAPLLDDNSIANLKDGFRGMPWGSKKSDMKALEFTDCKQMDQLVENCSAEKSTLKLDDAPLVHIRYKFVDDAFFGIALKFEAKHAEKVQALIYKELGQPTEFKDRIPQWKTEVFTAWLSSTHFSIDAKKPLEEAIAKRKK